MNSGQLYFEDLHKGDRWTSPKRVVTKQCVYAFAQLTGDHDPLHLDEDYARESVYREPIAHGLLGLSLLAGLSSNYPRVATVAFTEVESWQFKHPIYFGDTVYAETEIVDLRRYGARRGKVTWFRQLINQDQRVVQQGSLETVVAMRQPARQSVTPHSRSAEISLSIDAT